MIDGTGTNVDICKGSILDLHGLVYMTGTESNNA